MSLTFRVNALKLVTTLNADISGISTLHKFTEYQVDELHGTSGSRMDVGIGHIPDESTSKVLAPVAKFYIAQQLNR